MRRKEKLRSAKILGPRAREQKRSERLKKMAIRWGGREILTSEGFTPIPRTFIKYAASLKPFGLTPTERDFVVNLLYFKWDQRSPYPSYATLAERMGISVQYARDTARKLERKGLLRRIIRVGYPNEFDLQPLFDALANHVEAVQADARRAAKAKLAVA